jgi:cysteine desulfurase
MNSIYLDACSTTPLDTAVRSAMVACLEFGYVNPASQHRAGQLALARMDEAREVIRLSLGLNKSDRLILASGGTEANNLAVKGLSALPRSGELPGSAPNIVVSSVEHPSVLGAAESLRQRGFEIRLISAADSGVIDLDMLSHLVDRQTRLVCLMLVNNETGVIQPVLEAAAVCRQKGAALHCDAIQAIGKIPVDFGDLAAAGVTSLSVAPHKFHGPRGTGALILAGAELPLLPLLHGGFQQFGLRPGTEDVALAAGFAEAIRLAVTGLKETRTQLTAMRDRFERCLLDAIPDACINGRQAPRAPHCSNIAFPGDGQGGTTLAIDRQALMIACDARGVAIATGSACASGSSEPSHVLEAMGLDQRLIDSSVRICFSRLNRPEECVEAADRIINAVNQLRRSKTVRK